MNIEACTVSVHCGDFLDAIAPFNRIFFDKWIVVTSPEDDETQSVCRKWDLTCLVTKDATRDGGPFSKGRLIERGLQHLSGDCWVYCLDSDIVLPKTFHFDLHRAHLDPAKVHGFDRVMVKGWDEWKRLQNSGWLDRPSKGHPHSVDWPAGFPVGTRWAGSDGWCPLGFSTLWHRTGGGEEAYGARMKKHPSGHGNACREDVQMSHQWDRRDRILVPEVIVAHLESEISPCGINWKGRKSKRFGPPGTDGGCPVS